MQSVNSLRAWRTYAPILACALCTLAGCSSPDDASGDVVRVCTPNTPLPCTCPGSGPSTAACLPDGSGMAACACTEAVEAGATAQTHDAAGNTGDASVATPDSGVRPSDAGSNMSSAASDAATNGADGGGVTAAGPATPSAGCGTSTTAPSGNLTIDVDGTQRQYIVKVPTDYNANTPYRLIFAWHGLGGTAMQIASTYYGLATRSANGAIFIAAQGLPGTGQQSGLASWTNTKDSDITFTRKMLEWAKANYCIDTKRVFSIGMSNGGMMSNIVGCELGDSFRAIVAMSGGGPKGYAMKPCVGQLAVWISHGNKDDNVPFSYGQMSRDYWTKANHCGTETAPAMPGTCVEYQGCDPGFPVQFCEFDGGHMVPSFAAEAAWKFFTRF